MILSVLTLMYMKSAPVVRYERVQPPVIESPVVEASLESRFGR